ncbi:hypothetical protein NTE28_003596 [Vibrio harveyi]|nr:hypothetical protein [Vibrio harveyi]
MNENLRSSLIELFPEFQDILLLQNSVSNSYWEADLSTGKLLELTTLLFVCQSFKKFGATITIPAIYREKPELFYLRNEIPLHHSAQAGHSASLYSEIELTDKFLAAFTPKVIIQFGKSCLYVMREGNPIHELEKALKHDIQYKERPDIGIYSGKVSVSINGKVLTVTSINDGAEAHFLLEAKNSSIIPLVDYHEEGHHYTTTNAIIECSVNKSTRHADSQIKTYLDIFENESNTTVSSLFVNGGKDKSKYSTININMSSLVDSFSSKDIDQKLLSFINSIVSPCS